MNTHGLTWIFTSNNGIIHIPDIDTWNQIWW